MIVYANDPAVYPDWQNGETWPCGCLINDAGAHRGDGSSSGPCPDFRTVEEYVSGRLARSWVRRDA